MTIICSISLPHLNHTISLFFLRDFLFNITVLYTNFDAHFNALMLYIINVTKTTKKNFCYIKKFEFIFWRGVFVAMRFAKRNAYLCSHAKLYDFINFASFLMLLVGTHIWNSGYRQLCYTQFRYVLV